MKKSVGRFSIRFFKKCDDDALMKPACISWERRYSVKVLGSLSQPGCREAISLKIRRLVGAGIARGPV